MLKPLTKEVGSQAAEKIPPVKLIDVSSQTDSHNSDSVSGLKEQFQKLVNSVKELSALKRDLMERINATAPTNREFSEDESFGRIVSDALISTFRTEEECSSEVVRESPSPDFPQPLPALPSANKLNANVQNKNLAMAIMKSSLQKYKNLKGS